MIANPPSAVRRVVGVGCDLVARASVSVAAGEIATLRKSPGKLGDLAVGPKVLQHADDQTVVALAAVLRAVADESLDPVGFGDWGVIAAPSFLGRSAFDAAFPQFLTEGAWGVSPLLISSHSLHSVSGVVSQALQAHGPNLGVGGAPGGEEQALLAAAVMLAEGAVPGVWVVMTGWNPGWNGADDGRSPAVCEALALALTPSRSSWIGTRLVIAPGAIRAEPSNRRADLAHTSAPAPHASAMGDRVEIVSRERGGHGGS